MNGYVILHVTHGLFLGDSPEGAVWSRCNPPPEVDAAPVFPSAEEASNYARLIRVEGMLYVQEAQADRVMPWGMPYATMGALASRGFEPWLQEGTSCVGPPQ